MHKRKQPEPISFDEAKELWDSLTDNPQTHTERLTEQEAKQFRQKLYARIEAHEAKKRKRKIIRSLMVAAVLVLIGSVISYRSLYLPDVYQAHQNDMMITLKDGSKVTLFKGAKLTIEKSFPADTRDVFLEGNAVFNVTKSKTHPFIVHSGTYETKVHGTIFKIIQTGETFSVDLYEGKVSVSKSDNTKETYVLNPRETFSNLGSLKVASITPTHKNITDNKILTATLSFEDVTLQDVITTIEKTYGVNIRFPEEKRNTIISVTGQNTTVNEMIQLIIIQLNLNTKK